MTPHEATIPAESLAGLNVEQGDTLTVTRRSETSITLSAKARRGDSPMTGRQFIQKWKGAFDLDILEEKSQDNPRLAHLVSKHVK